MTAPGMFHGPEMEQDTDPNQEARPNETRSTPFRAKTFHVASKRCPRRILDATRIHNYFLANGWTPTRMGRAELIVVYTCGGFQTWEEACLRTIRKATKMRGRVIVTGCLLKINPDVLEDLDIERLQHEELDQLDDFIGATVPYASVPLATQIEGVQFIHRSLTSRLRNTSARGLAQKALRRLGRLGRRGPEQVYNLEIGRGCAGECTYCAIRLAMGQLHSRPLREIVEEFRRGLELGYHDFRLVAGDIGCYGVDVGTDIVELLERLLAFPDEFRLILNDMAPQWLVKYFDRLVPVLQQHHKRIQSLMLPIQSGSNDVLHRMRRPYRIEEVIDRLQRLRRLVPELKVQTHIMVGFPGETDSDFQQSLKLLQRVDFHSVSIYQYEARKGTESFQMTDRVDPDVASERVRKLGGAVGD